MDATSDIINRRAAAPAAPVASPGRDDPVGFDGVEAKAMANLEKLAHKLVASTFLAPMLDRMQEDPLRSDLMGGGFADSVFRKRLNARLSDRMAQAMNVGLVADIRKRFEQQILANPDQVKRLANMRIDTLG